MNSEFCEKPVTTRLEFLDAIKDEQQVPIP